MCSIEGTLKTSRNESSVVEEEQNCKAIDKSTGELCGETESLSILNEFQRLYEARIEKVDRELEDEFDRVSMKMQIMKEWIRDLGEQNVMLVHTVEDLEQAAYSRLKLLEEKLRQSSTIVSQNMSRTNHTGEAISVLSNRVSELEKDEVYMQQKIEFLQSDIRGLLELIRRGRQENSWNLNGIKFFEIQPDDIPAPIDCTCGQEETNNEKTQTLKLQVEQLQKNEKNMIAYQAELEDKLADLTEKLLEKDDTIKKYAAEVQSFNNNVKRHSAVLESAACDSPVECNGRDVDIVLTADIAENILVEKDLETRDLKRRLQDAEAKLVTLSRNNNPDPNGLRALLDQKCKEVQEMEFQLANLQKESLETREALTTEVAEKHDVVMSLRKEVALLEEKCRQASTQIHFKEDIIRDMRKELKQIKDIEATSCASKRQDKLSNLIKTKMLMEKDRQALLDIKVELEKAFEELLSKEKEEYTCDPMSVHKVLGDFETLLTNYKTQGIETPDRMEDFRQWVAPIELQLNSLQNMLESKFMKCTSTKKLDANSIKCKVAKYIERIAKMCSEKENEISLIDSTLKAEGSDYILDRSINAVSTTDVLQQSKLMEIFRACTIEAQGATEDIREEIGFVVSSFASRHRKYAELNKVVGSVQDQLIKTRERIMESINRVQLQDEEKTRHNERLSMGKMKLKDLKNEINHAQSQLSCRINEVQENAQEFAMLGYTEICVCNNLLSHAIEEIEEASCNLRMFQTQGCTTTSMLKDLNGELHDINSCMRDLQRKISETLVEHEEVERTFCEKEQRLEKLEREMVGLQEKMQGVLETYLSSNEQMSSDSNIIDNQVHCQTVKEILKTKQELQRLKKQYDDLRHKSLQRTSSTQCDERTCEWKCRVSDLQDEIRILQQEAKCKQEANNFLRTSIETMENELRCVQGKAENCRRSYSTDSMELKKKIIELQNTLKSQKEVEQSLRQHLNDSELELKQSKDLQNSFNVERGAKGALLDCSCNQLKNEATNILELFEELQSIMYSIRCDLQDLEYELHKLISESSMDSSPTMRSVMLLIEKLNMYWKCKEFNKCVRAIQTLMDTLYSKDKLLENKEEIIRIQKDSLVMTQAEVKELHQQLQEKIDSQTQIISQYEKEKSELLKQNELQVQTIGHLQNAVVEAKRCLDQMGHKTMSDLQEKSEIIRTLTICADETQSQYNDCFAEAVEQDKLLDLQRDAISDLQEQIRRMDYEKSIAIALLHTVYYSILSVVQKQLEARLKDFHSLKDKIHVLIQSENCMRSKYQSAKKSWQEAEDKLQDLKKNERDAKTYDSKMCQCKMEMEDKDIEDEFRNFSREHELKSEIETLVRENEDLKRQLQKWKLDFDIIDEELKIERRNDVCAQQITMELQKIRNIEGCLRSENKQLKSDFREQAETIDDLRNKLEKSEERNKEYLSELNSAEEMLSILRERNQSLKSLLKEKSDSMAKLQADYEVLKNDNCILKTDNNILDNKAKEDIYHLRRKVKDLQLQLCATEDNYHSVTQDFNKTQEKLVTAAKREADLQETLTNTEKEYCTKLLHAEKEESRLGDLVDKLSEELEDIRRNYSCRNAEICKLQDICKSYAEQVESMQQHMEKEKEKIMNIEESNNCLAQQLQECMEQNCSLVQEKTFVERHNCKVVAELEEMHKSLLELKKECHLKNKSLVCMSAELTQTAMSRSELCNESQYVVSCIRVWMEEQKKYVETLASKLKFKHQQLVQLGFEKKALLVTIRELRRVNNLLTQRLRRTHRAGRCFSAKSMCGECYAIPSRAIQNKNAPPTSGFPQLHTLSIGPIKTARRTSLCGNPCWFSKMKYLTKELRKNNLWYDDNLCNRTNAGSALEENRDCGYQSSTSK